MDPVLRPGRADDFAALERLYPRAFPDEDLLPLLRDLLNGQAPVLSLVAEQGGQIVGHVAFTECGVEGQPGQVAMLAPLAVAPEVQRTGIGSALVREGLHRVTEQGAVRALVLGDPAYYGRFGFQAETGIAPPYTLPDEWVAAWQGLVLDPDSPALHGVLDVPQAWKCPGLWS